MDYYWSAFQTEWATDLLFKDPRALAGLFPLRPGSKPGNTRP
jgi:hypothetical protein